MQELLDIVEPSGQPLGKTKPRSSVHRDGDWHRTVHIWIVNRSGEVLFQKRAPGKESFPEKWDVSAAGHISAGESPVQAALKELLEELGIHAEERNLKFLFSTKSSAVQNSGKFIDNEICEVFLVHEDVLIKNLVLQPSEVTEARYFPQSTLQNLIPSPDPAFAPHPEEYRLFSQHLLKSGGKRPI